MAAPPAKFVAAPAEDGVPHPNVEAVASVANSPAGQAESVLVKLPQFRFVTKLPFTAGNCPEPVSCTSSLFPLNVLPCKVSGAGVALPSVKASNPLAVV